jgi:hypothetical protein
MMQQDPGGQLSQEKLISMLLWTVMHLGTLALLVYVLASNGIIQSLSVLTAGVAPELLAGNRILGFALIAVALMDYPALFILRRSQAEVKAGGGRSPFLLILAVFAFSPWIYLLVLVLMHRGMLPD